MNDTSTLWCLPSFLECPGLYLHLACCDECLQVEESVSFLDEAIDTTLFQSQFLKEELLVFIVVEASNVFFCLGSNNHALSTLFCCESLNLFCPLITILCCAFINITYIEHRLAGKKEKVLGCQLFLLGLKIHCTGVFALLKTLFVSLKYCQLHLSFLIAC